MPAIRHFGCGARAYERVCVLLGAHTLSLFARNEFGEAGSGAGGAGWGVRCGWRSNLEAGFSVACTLVTTGVDVARRLYIPWGSALWLVIYVCGLLLMPPATEVQIFHLFFLFTQLAREHQHIHTLYLDVHSPLLARNNPYTAAMPFSIPNINGMFSRHKTELY